MKRLIRHEKLIKILRGLSLIIWSVMILLIRLLKNGPPPVTAMDASLSWKIADSILHPITLAFGVIVFFVFILDGIVSYKVKKEEKEKKRAVGANSENKV